MSAPGGAAAAEGAAHASFFRSYSRHNCPSSEPAPEIARPRWLDDVEEHTSEFRAHRAGAHRLNAQRARKASRFGMAEWHEDRADGQRERFERVRECASTEIVTRCADCHHECFALAVQCKHWRVCVSCRGARAQVYRARFEEARERALRAFVAVRKPSAPGGCWAEKFATFTVPHSGVVARDLRAVTRAWRLFRKMLADHLRIDRGVPSALVRVLPFVRVVEVTAGRENDGHAHLHVWLLAPFLPHAWLRMAWGRALARCGYELPTRPRDAVLAELGDGFERKQAAVLLVTRRGVRGRPLDAVPWPVLDIRKCDGGSGAELIKYLVKDMERDSAGVLRLQSPGLVARLYEGLEGLRTIQTSPGFWRPPHDAQSECRACGSSNTTRSIRPKEEGA